MTQTQTQAKKPAQKMVVANWKMHGNLKKNQTLLKAYIHSLNAFEHTQVVVCVPYPYLAQCQQLLASTHIAWGAQNLAKMEEGAYTGEVSAAMLRDFGATFVIIGHSERSTAYCESDENVAQKFVTAKKNGLTPILCVGETLIEREAGMQLQVVAKQLATIIRQHGEQVFENTVVSYEPIWAIGTGLAAAPAQVEEMLSFIRAQIADSVHHVKILYGGSVNPQNALQLCSVKNCDGGLVGRCSLDASEFEQICTAAEAAAAQIAA